MATSHDGAAGRAHSPSLGSEGSRGIDIPTVLCPWPASFGVAGFVAQPREAVGDRFYAICNCCKCCCGGLEAMTRRGIPMVASSGFVAEVDEGACISCGDCEEACPFGAIHVPYRAEVTWDTCMGCGVCEGKCATGAVALVRDERKGIPLDVRALA